MRKEAFEGNISRLLRNEIQYEIQSSSSSKPVRFFPFSLFVVDFNLAFIMDTVFLEALIFLPLIISAISIFLGEIL